MAGRNQNLVASIERHLRPCRTDADEVAAPQPPDRACQDGSSAAAERSGKNARRMLEDVAQKTGDEDLAVSVLTVLELAHGAVRADTAERRDRGQRFLTELMSAVPVQPITASIALRAGQLDGQSQAQGVRIPLPDLLVGVSALDLRYSVATANVRHFQLIPDLVGVRV